MFLAKYYTLEEIGLFSLIAGIVAIAPPCFGWGLNFFVSREIIGVPLDEARALIRNRLVVTLISFLLLFLILLTLFLLKQWVLSSLSILLFVCLLFCEMLSFDINYCFLLPRGLSFQSSILIFIRTAVWIPLLFFAHYLDPSFCSLDLILFLWVSGNIVSLIAALSCLNIFVWGRSSPYKARIGLKPFFTRAGFCIYLNDLYYASGSFLDRFIITFFLGIDLTGIYFLFWQVTNSITVLISTGTQVFTPLLIAESKIMDFRKWKLYFKQMLCSSVFTFSFFSMIAVSLIPYTLHLLNKDSAIKNISVLWILLFGSFFKVLSDNVAIGLTSLFKDNFYSVSSIISLCMSLFLIFIGAQMGSLCYVAWSVSSGFLAAFFIRLCFLLKSVNIF